MSNCIKIAGYDTFRCIADQCPFSCCQQWRIGVDDKTYAQWQGKSLSVNEVKSKKKVLLCDKVKKEGSETIIKLNQDKQCPFLSQDKLCHIVLNFGDDWLSETCATFPRQINHLKHHIEYALDPGCPAVIDKMQEQKEEMVLEYHGDLTQVEELFQVREMLLACMRQKEYTLPERLMVGFFHLLNLKENPSELKKDKIDDEQVAMQPIVAAIRKMSFNKANTFYENNELFLDSIDNYRKQRLYTEYLEELGVFAEEIQEKDFKQQLAHDVQEFEKLFQDYQDLMTRYLTTEIFATCLLEDMLLEDMIIAFEWISMVYVVVRQAIFLKWMRQPHKEVLDYTIVRDYIMIMSRVTGYDQEDRKEYLQNSFEEVIWQWGYQALILGNGVM